MYSNTFIIIAMSVIILLVYNNLRMHKIRKDALLEREETANLLRQISLQKDEIEALYEETYAINEELTKSQKELNRHIKELTALNEVVHTINSSLSLEDVLKHICIEAGKILEFDIAIIMTVGNCGKKLIVKHWEGPSIEENLKEKIIDIHKEGVCGYVAKTKTPVLVKDVDSFKGYIRIHKDVKQEMSAPLIYGDELVGVFNVESFNDYTFDEDKLKLLCTFAAFAAIAINNAKLFENMSNTYYDTSKALAKAIEAKDTYTKGHCDRVTELCIKTAEFMDFDLKRTNSLKFAATLHDIGKIGVSEKILNKPGPLTNEEMDLVRMHPAIGYHILSEIRFLEHERNIIYQHHERYDGRGYPNKLKGDQILLEAKILSLADSFDAMTSKRSYRNPVSVESAIEQIKLNAGTQFDPEVSEIFISVIRSLYRQSA